MRRIYRSIRTRGASARSSIARRLRRIRNSKPSRKDVRSALLATVPSAALVGFAGMQAAAAKPPTAISAPAVPSAMPSAAPAQQLPDRPPEAPVKAVEASYYGKGFAGKPTASGATFDPERLTAAHRTLPFGTIVDVTNAATGKSVKVEINDRGPFHGNREIDLSVAAAREIGMLGTGTAKVILDVVKRG